MKCACIYRPNSDGDDTQTEAKIVFNYGKTRNNLLPLIGIAQGVVELAYSLCGEPAQVLQTSKHTDLIVKLEDVCGTWRNGYWFFCSLEADSKVTIAEAGAAIKVAYRRWRLFNGPLEQADEDRMDYWWSHWCSNWNLRKIPAESVWNYVVYAPGSLDPQIAVKLENVRSNNELLDIFVANSQGAALYACNSKSLADLFYWLRECVNCDLPAFNDRSHHIGASNCKSTIKGIPDEKPANSKRLFTFNTNGWFDWLAIPNIQIAALDKYKIPIFSNLKSDEDGSGIIDSITSNECCDNLPMWLEDKVYCTMFRVRGLYFGVCSENIRNLQHLLSVFEGIAKQLQEFGFAEAPVKAFNYMIVDEKSHFLCSTLPSEELAPSLHEAIIKMREGVFSNEEQVIRIGSDWWLSCARITKCVVAFCASPWQVESNHLFATMHTDNSWIHELSTSLPIKISKADKKLSG